MVIEEALSQIDISEKVQLLTGKTKRSHHNGCIYRYHEQKGSPMVKLSEHPHHTV